LTSNNQTTQKVKTSKTSPESLEVALMPRFNLLLVISLWCFTFSSAVLVLKAQQKTVNLEVAVHKGNKLKKCLSLRGGANPIDELDYRYFLAGGICAALSHGITTPLDVVKTRIQKYPYRYTEGVVKATRDIIKEKGAIYLTKGLSPTIVGYGLEGALKFGFYEACKGLFKNLTGNTFVNFLIASVVAGAIASVTLCPMEDARIRMVTDEEYKGLSLVESLMKVHNDNGLLSTFGNLPAMLSKQVPYTMAKQVSFDTFAKSIYVLCESMKMDVANMHIMIMLLSAFLASILACLASQPGDVLLTASTEGGNFIDHIRQIQIESGLAGFFSGLVARILHVSSIITSQLVIYDGVKVAVGLPHTGH